MSKRAAVTVNVAYVPQRHLPHRQERERRVYTTPQAAPATGQSRETSSDLQVQRVQKQRQQAKIANEKNHEDHTNPMSYYKGSNIDGGGGQGARTTPLRVFDHGASRVSDGVSDNHAPRVDRSGKYKNTGPEPDKSMETLSQRLAGRTHPRPRPRPQPRPAPRLTPPRSLPAPSPVAPTADASALLRM